MKAACNGHIDIVESLLARPGIEINLKNKVCGVIFNAASADQLSEYFIFIFRMARLHLI